MKLNGECIENFQITHTNLSWLAYLVLRIVVYGLLFSEEIQLEIPNTPQKRDDSKGGKSRADRFLIRIVIIVQPESASRPLYGNSDARIAPKTFVDCIANRSLRIIVLFSSDENLRGKILAESKVISEIVFP